MVYQETAGLHNRATLDGAIGVVREAIRRLLHETVWSGI